MVEVLRVELKQACRELTEYKSALAVGGEGLSQHKGLADLFGGSLAVRTVPFSTPSRHECIARMPQFYIDYCYLMLYFLIAM